MHIVLDISRLLGLAWYGQPTGVDRVEIAHARHWRKRPPGEVTFVAQSPWGWFAALPDGLARSLLIEAEAVVAPGKEGGLARFRAMAAAAVSQRLWGGGRRALAQALARNPHSVFLVLSHRGVHHPGAIERVVKAGARFVPMLHDLIPLTHPEYCRPFSTTQHARRLQVISALADGVITPTEHVARQYEAMMQAQGLAAPPAQGVGLGLDLTRADTPLGASRFPGEDPYFLLLGTIEPRKNHLLPLLIWREFAAQGWQQAPRLVIVGRRGWENEAVFRLLDRTDFNGRVEERGRLCDRETARLMRGATALLSPSFTEGFGIPLAEALASGTPVISSDIPSAREVGGEVPEYHHPLETAAWTEAIRTLAAPGSARREAQLRRLSRWQPPCWERHFQRVESFLERICGQARPAQVEQRQMAGALQH